MSAASDFHLDTNSPCINAGNNGYVLTSTDLDGNSRIVGPLVDIGAYEYRLPTIVLTSQPTNQTLIGGQDAYFTVSGISPYPLSYRWQFGGTNIAGATNATLILPNVQSNNAGNYSVLVSNGAVSVASSNAALSVLYPPPTIVAQPTNFMVFGGSNAVFSVAATGYWAMTYQWQLDGANLAESGEFHGTTSASLNVDPAYTNDNGNYQVIVANAYTAVTSSAAALAVFQAPVITSQPADAVTMIYGNALISVTVTGAPPFAYQWKKNGVNLANGESIAGADTATLTILNPQFADAGSYVIVVSNRFGVATSRAASLAVAPVVEWGDQTPTPPANATNLIAIAAGGDFFLALRGDGTVVAWGADTNILSIPPNATNVVAIAAGDYHCLALRGNGTVVGWGENTFGEATPPPTATNVVAIAAGGGPAYGLGGAFSLALREDGTVIGWGDDSLGEASPSANATNVIAISAGGGFLFSDGLSWLDEPGFGLALRQDGTVIGWGYDNLGPNHAASQRDEHGAQSPPVQAPALGWPRLEPSLSGATIMSVSISRPLTPQMS